MCHVKYDKFQNILWQMVIGYIRKLILSTTNCTICKCSVSLYIINSHIRWQTILAKLKLQYKTSNDKHRLQWAKEERREYQMNSVDHLRHSSPPRHSTDSSHQTHPCHRCGRCLVGGKTRKNYFWSVIHSIQ